MDKSGSLVFEHYDLREIFRTKILANNSTFQSFEEYEVGSDAYCRVHNLLLTRFVADIFRHPGIELSNSTFPRFISVSDWSV